MREIFFHCESAGQPSGSPPRVREGLSTKIFVISSFRITPARAGRTQYDYWSLIVLKDHPRSRGKDSACNVEKVYVPGSPPLAREGPRIEIEKQVKDRITPARAGRT